MAVFMGDAMGLGVECMSPSEIREKFGYVNRLISNQYHKYEHVAKQPVGTISDDGQTSLAMMDSLRRKRGYDIQDMKRAHAEALDGKWGEPVGWGLSTRTAATNIKNGTWAKPTEGGGNGPMIKLAPFAIYCAFKTSQTAVGKFTNSFNASLLKKCREITEITHGDPRCIVASYCQSRMIIRALQHEIPLMPLKIASMFVEDAKYAESKLQDVKWPADGLLSDRISDVINMKNLTTCQSMCAFNFDTGFVSTSICVSQSSYVMNSYPFVVYCVSKYLPCRSLMYALEQTISAGADADSNGSMVGAIAGAFLGLQSVNQRIFMGIQNYEMILKQIDEFLKSLC